MAGRLAQLAGWAIPGTRGRVVGRTPAASPAVSAPAEPTPGRLSRASVDEPVRPIRRGRRAPSAHDSGRASRTDPDFYPPAIGPNALAGQTLELTRRRVRYLVDNNPIVAGARGVIRHNVVGTGIRLQPDTGDPELDQRVDTWWRRLCEGVDVGREQTLGESQAQFFDEIFAAGEVLVYYPIATDGRGKDRPAIELVDAERVPLSGTIRVADGHRMRQGVEFDAQGRRVAYYVLTDHPNDDATAFAGYGLRNAKRIDAGDARLAFVSRRVGQIRGVPPVATVVGTVRLEDAFQEAYLLLARAAACVALFFKNGAKSDAPLMGADHESPVIDAATGDPLEVLEPGMMGLLPKDVEPELMSANLPPPSFEMTTRIMLRRIAAGLSISYAALARDYSEATFSATRAEQLEDRKAYRPLQELVFHQHTRPFYRRALAWAVASGEIVLGSAQRARMLADPERFYQCRPVFPGWEWVNPHQEAQAAEVELRTRMVSLPTLAASKGRDWKTEMDLTLEAEQHWDKRRAELGLAPAPFHASASDAGASDPDAGRDDDAGNTKPDGEEAD